MPWWGWILVGAVLLGSEMIVTTEFYLAVLGTSALLVGLFALAFGEFPEWQQWLGFAGISVVLLVFARRRFAKLRPVTEEEIRDRIVGEYARVLERIEPGGVGRAELRGTTWKARNTGSCVIEQGTEVPATKIDGLTLELRSD